MMTDTERRIPGAVFDSEKSPRYHSVMRDGEATWTLDELTAEVEAALAEGYEGPASGRVRDVPDRRTIRYYTTLGLIDRPAAMRGRTALYGRRHLLQLVAIKKLQAGGRSLAEIQRSLTGQGDAELARIAGQGGQGSVEVRAPGPPPPGRQLSRQEPVAPEAPAGAVGPPMALCGVPLQEGVTLLFAPSRPIGAEDLEAIRDAAVPMLRILSRAGLIPPREGPGRTS